MLVLTCACADACKSKSKPSVVKQLAWLLALVAVSAMAQTLSVCISACKNHTKSDTSTSTMMKTFEMIIVIHTDACNLHVKLL